MTGGQESPQERARHPARPCPTRPVPDRTLLFCWDLLVSADQRRRGSSPVAGGRGHGRREARCPGRGRHRVADWRGARYPGEALSPGSQMGARCPSWARVAEGARCPTEELSFGSQIHARGLRYPDRGLRVASDWCALSSCPSTARVAGGARCPVPLQQSRVADWRSSRPWADLSGGR